MFSYALVASVHSFWIVKINYFIVDILMFLLIQHDRMLLDLVF